MTAHRLLFVCLGNICRSSMAEGVFFHVAHQEGLADRFHLDSAGTAGWHIGNPPDPRGQQAALARGIDISQQRARQVARQDFKNFDLLLAMDETNAQDLRRMAPGEAEAGKVALFLEFAPELDASEVPDPYYGGDEGFEEVLNLVEAASRNLIATLMR